MSYYDDTPPSPFKSRWFIVAAVVVAVIVVMAVALVLTRDGSPQAQPSSEPVATSTETRTKKASGSGSGSVEGESVCGLAPGDQAVPSTPPAAKWELVGAMAIPTDPKIGPGVVSDEGIHSCYAHSPTGALYAAAGFIADSGGLDLEVIPDMLEDRLVPGGTADAVIDRARQAADEADSEMPKGFGGEKKLTLTGFSIISATVDVVTVDLVMGAVGASQQGALTVTMQWYEGDWRVVVTDVNGLASHPVTSSFIPWGP